MVDEIRDIETGENWRFPEGRNIDYNPDPDVLYIEDVEGLSEALEHHEHEHEHEDSDGCDCGCDHDHHHS
jgi:hypothetical protein